MMNDDLDIALNEVKNRLITYLDSMGVDVEFDETTGLRGLVSQIRNIEPTIIGVPINTSLTISCNLNRTYETGDTIVFTGGLSAGFDDTSSDDLDLVGFLKGASISFYNGNQLIGSVVTDNNGEYSFSYIIPSDATLNVKAVYAGSDDYGGSETQPISVDIVNSANSIVLSSSKSVLSYNDEDSCTLSVVVKDIDDEFVEGKTISFCLSDEYGLYDEVLTAKTDEFGECSVSYDSGNRNNVSVVATSNGVDSNTIVLDDCYYYNTATSSDNKSDWISYNYILTNVQNKGTNVYSNTNTEGLYYWNHLFHTTDNFEFEWIVVDKAIIAPIVEFRMVNSIGNKHTFQITLENNSFDWNLYEPKNITRIFPSIPSNDFYYHFATTSFSDGDIFRLVKEGNLLHIYLNDVLIQSVTINLYEDFYIGFGGYGGGRNMTFKDFRVRYLPRTILTTNKSIVNIYDEDTTTISLQALDTFNNPITDENILFTVTDDSDNTLTTLTRTTDENGECSIVYESSGVGDVYFKADLLDMSSDKLLVEDCYYYDSCSSANLSRYTGVNINSSSYDSNGFYNTYSYNQTFGTFYVPISEFPDEYVYEADIQSYSGSNNQPRLALMENSSEYWGFRILMPTSYSSTGICTAHYTASGGDWADNIVVPSVALNTSSWYHVKLVYKNQTLTSSISDMSGNVLATVTYDSGVINPIGIGFGNVAAYNRIYVKNFKLKKLNSLTLESDIETLSYVDEDSCTLSATYNGALLEGVRINFDIIDSNEDFVENLGSSLTDENGVASIDYDASNRGDIIIKASCGEINSNKLIVEDYYKYIPCSSNDDLSYFGEVISVEGYTGGTLGYDETMDALYMISTSSGVKAYPINLLDGLDKLTFSAKIYLTYSSTDLCCGLMCLGANHTGIGFIKRMSYYTQHIFNNNAWVSNTDVSVSGRNDEWLVYKVIVDGYNVSASISDLNGNVLYTKTNTLNSVSSNFTTLSERKYGVEVGYNNVPSIKHYVKDIKIIYDEGE